MTKWYRHVQRMPDGTYIWWRGNRHYAGEDAKVIDLILKYSRSKL